MNDKFICLTAFGLGIAGMAAHWGNHSTDTVIALICPVLLIVGAYGLSEELK